ncbi:MAG: aminotransferase class IV [Bdellovibrionales bacterium]|nr:aminotransferase class IV [Bdellovibrionales bacterium]
MKVYLDGKLVDHDKATVSIFDRGFLFSDSVYEVIQVCNNKLFLFNEHIERLHRSLKELNIPIPAVDFLQICRNLLKDQEIVYGGIYIQVTRGRQENRSHFWYGQNIKPFVVAFVQASPPNLYKNLKVITYPDLRWQRCDIKSNSLLANVLAREEAAVRASDEALLINESGFINEGSSTNVYMIKQNKVITPPLRENILPGVTRKFCLETLISMGITCEESTLTKQELLTADEIWLSSSTKDVLPVEELDGSKINFNRDKSLWLKLHENFQKRKIDFLI